ncbi:MAG: fumarylacetoacetate hydrolase family protein [Proteobacteria bacterium]|nr:fumarylacetoacetate hydrolase family protein [Pseudomonadota bacterium]
MRLFNHERPDGRVCLGAWRAGSMIDLGEGSLIDVIRNSGWERCRALAESARPLGEQVRMLPPIAHPPKILCVGLNYADHRAEARVRPAPAFPDFFVRFASTLVGHGGVLLKPRVSQEFDYEGELAVVIGKGGRAIRKEDALAHVAGYSIFNDASVRDYQFRASQWTWGKNFDATGAFGPELITPDELPRSVKEGLQIQTRINGQVVQSASTADLIFDLPQLIAMASEGMTLEPGDVIVTGTPSGVGMAREPQLFLQAGDMVEVRIEGIGVLRNFVEDEPSSGPVRR